MFQAGKLEASEVRGYLSSLEKETKPRIAPER
jgi:hypothetical protein